MGKSDSLLSKMKDSLDLYANLTAQVIGMDIDIYDTTFETIAASHLLTDYRYQNIKDHAFHFAHALETGRTEVVFDIKSSEKCRGCSRYKSCRQSFQFSEPMFLNGKPIGVIGIIGMSEEKQVYCKENKDVIIQYLHETANLIISKAALLDTIEKQKASLDSLHYILEKVHEGIAVADAKGHVSKLNEIGKKILNVKEDTDVVLDLQPEEGTIEDLKEYLFHIGSSTTVVAGKLLPLEVGTEKALLLFKDRKTAESESMLRTMNLNGMSIDSIIGSSARMNELRKNIRAFANTNSSVLIQGESGTGKELVARSLHQLSRRSGQPFIAINCAAIPENLLESELFGYAKGAFSGADIRGKAGKFEIANHGTIFLDEIGDMPLSTQAKILRVLQEHELTRLGDNRTIRIDVRVIAATHKDLKAMIRERTFREDLYYRLNVVPIRTPSLRERPEDIAEIARYCVLDLCRRMEIEPVRISQDFYDCLEQYNWPGNVRELQNVLEYAVDIAEPGSELSPELIRNRLHIQEKEAPDVYNIRSEEEKTIRRALEEYGRLGYTKEEIARELGIGPATLYRKIRKYKLK